MRVRLTSSVITALLLVVTHVPAAPAYNVPRNVPLQYAVEISQRYKMSTPWTGDLSIKVNSDGIVNGQYRSNSIRPDPFHGTIVNVTGGLSGDYIQMSFGTGGRVSAKGTVSADKIEGTFYDTKNTRYDFLARRVTSP